MPNSNEFNMAADIVKKLKTKPNNDEFILWTNYYGNARDNEIKNVSEKYPNLIIDNCHAFFSKPIEGKFNCYSTRKFFGVSDGGYLVKLKNDIIV